jgi:hypothetical protein
VFNVAAAGDQVDVSINLAAGQVCFYEVDASNTAPGFTISSNSGELSIGYVEVNNATAFAGVTATTAGPSNNVDYLSGSPKNESPPRSQCVSTSEYSTYKPESS